MMMASQNDGNPAQPTASADATPVSLVPAASAGDAPQQAGETAWGANAPPCPALPGQWSDLPGSDDLSTHLPEPSRTVSPTSEAKPPIDTPPPEPLAVPALQAAAAPPPPPPVTYTHAPYETAVGVVAQVSRAEAEGTPINATYLLQLPGAPPLTPTKEAQVVGAVAYLYRETHRRLVSTGDADDFDAVKWRDVSADFGVPTLEVTVAWSAMVDAWLNSLSSLQGHTDDVRASVSRLVLHSDGVALFSSRSSDSLPGHQSVADGAYAWLGVVVVQRKPRHTEAAPQHDDGSDDGIVHAAPAPPLQQEAVCVPWGRVCPAAKPLAKTWHVQRVDFKWPPEAVVRGLQCCFSAADGGAVRRAFRVVEWHRLDPNNGDTTLSGGAALHVTIVSTPEVDAWLASLGGKEPVAHSRLAMCEQRLVLFQHNPAGRACADGLVKRERAATPTRHATLVRAELAPGANKKKRARPTQPTRGASDDGGGGASARMATHRTEAVGRARRT